MSASERYLLIIINPLVLFLTCFLSYIIVIIIHFYLRALLKVEKILKTTRPNCVSILCCAQSRKLFETKSCIYSHELNDNTILIHFFLFVFLTVHSIHTRMTTATTTAERIFLCGFIIYILFFV